MESPLLKDRLAEIEREAEDKKVQLTLEVRKYIEEKIRKIQEKLLRGEKIQESALTFLDEIKLWISLDQELRTKYPSIESMLHSEEIKDAQIRHISLHQWCDVLALCKALGHSNEYVEDAFEFPGNGNIEILFLQCIDLPLLKTFPANLNIKGVLTINGCPLESLPPGLKVRGRVSIERCYQLKNLPPDLLVHGDLAMDKSLNEQVRMDAERLKKEGRILGQIIKIL